jgi:phosphatidate cytidylyltransferase
MLLWRLLVSAILIPAFVGLFYLDNLVGDAAPVLFALVLLIAIRCAWEMVELFRVRSFEPSFWQTAFLSCVVVATVWLPHWRGLSAQGDHYQITSLASDEAPILAFAASLLWLLASNAIRYRAPGSRMETLGAELLIVSYVGVFLCLTAKLRWVNGGGYLALGSLIIAAKCGDIGAYTLGRLFGRRKMAPLLSPGKTWAGAVGALIGGAVGAWLWLRFGPALFKPSALTHPAAADFQPSFHYGRSSIFIGYSGAVYLHPSDAWAVVYGLLIGLAGLIGDLCESLIKRDLGKKDAASLFPGFGGLLDLTDSVLYAGPVAYVLWRMLPLEAWPQ